VKIFAYPLAAVVVLALSAFGQTGAPRSIREECLKTLPMLTEALLKTQIADSTARDRGALVCPETNDLHTRAAEAVYPFAVMFKVTQEERYLRASVALGNWLIAQQAKEGEWPETPWTWTGTTADQLLMMALAYPIVDSHLSATEVRAWKTCIKRAGDYLVKYMHPDFATINYCATTPATLAATYRVIANPAYLDKARSLARMVLARMDEDGFIQGEAARVGSVKYGIDLGYEMDMSLWGLGLYARLAGDTLVNRSVRRALETHLSFVYPDGMIDGSWGTRCYKWTTYGSKTADGCQILFSLFSQEDTRYRTAAIRNLEYLRTMMRGGVLGNGPQYFGMTTTPPCNYPTFARAKNLALAISFGDAGGGQLGPLPTEKAGMLKLFPTVRVAIVRTKSVVATVSAYQYVDQENWGEGRYSQFPGGGSACNIWLENYGLLQTSSPTRYVRGEVIHMPEIKDSIRCLTPRIEFSDSGRLYTNLYERSAALTAENGPKGTLVVSSSGELRTERQLPGGVAYGLTHTFLANGVEKRVEIRYHSRAPVVDIVEPIVQWEGMEARRVDSRTVFFSAKGKQIRFQVLSGAVMLEAGRDKEKYWQPFPAVRCYPILLKMHPPEQPYTGRDFKREIIYRITME
jgi:hypothetical protein